ncbi:MAG: redox-regulated ATPase YchF, partial [bacterium]|nr:redox-regulated ATPase YchF [bacterium]
MGIVGLPNVGKSTLFNALTKKSVPAENFPFCTIDPSVGVVAVPDERIQKLAEFSKSAKVIPAAIEFVDIAGLVKGAAEGEGLGNKFLSHIREVDAVAEVVRIFEDDNIIHVHGTINPLKDIEVINLELAIADTETIEKRLTSASKDAKRGDKTVAAEVIALEKVRATLASGKSARDAGLNDDEQKLIKSLGLLTAKPVLYVLNKKSGGTNLDEVNDDRYKKLTEFLKREKAISVIVDANIESDLREMTGDEKIVFRKELGGEEDGINALIRSGYDLLDLITYFTTGEDETRAWTIPRNARAPEAGAAIHSDFRDRFIRAEVIFWKDLLDSGSYAKAREKGLVRT